MEDILIQPSFTQSLSQQIIFPHVQGAEMFPTKLGYYRNINRVHGLFQATVNVERPPISLQPLFEKLYAIYNVAQAGLSYLQKYPELAVQIFTIQRVLLVTDFLGYGLTLHYLYNIDKREVQEP